MTSSLEKIIESKRAMRRQLAERTVAEKLRLLEALRERQMDLGRAPGTTPHAKA